MPELSAIGWKLSMLAAFAWAPVPITGALGTALGTQTSVAAPGTPPADQLPALNQSVLTSPSQVRSTVPASHGSAALDGDENESRAMIVKPATTAGTTAIWRRRIIRSPRIP